MTDIARDDREREIKTWLECSWRKVKRLELVRCDDFRQAGSDILASLNKRPDLDRIRDPTSTGKFAGDACRCHGGYSILLYDVNDLLIGEGNVCGGKRVAWNRSTYRNDLEISNPLGLIRLLIEIGVPGQSKILLPGILDTFDLHEVDGQIRKDLNPDVKPPWIPSALWDAVCALPPDGVGVLAEGEGYLRALSGADAIDSVDPNQAELLLRWLGYVPWPAEAMAGDGVLLQSRLTGVEEGVIVGLIRGNVDIRCSVGAAIWSTFVDDDIAILHCLGDNFWNAVSPG